MTDHNDTTELHKAHLVGSHNTQAVAACPRCREEGREPSPSTRRVPPGWTVLRDDSETLIIRAAWWWPSSILHETLRRIAKNYGVTHGLRAPPKVTMGASVGRIDWNNTRT